MMSNTADFHNAFTIDVEDGVSLAMKNFFGIDTSQTTRVVTCTYQILELLSRYNAKATFFVVGKVAEDFPELVKAIHNNGHEVGIHGYNHIRYDHLDYQAAYNEINDTKKMMEDLIGASVRGHRAPAFSINEKTYWVLDILSEVGLMYDSSIVPANRNGYGYSGFNRDIVEIAAPSGGELIEVPLSVVGFPGRGLFALGGGYLRMFPYIFTDYAVKNISRIRPVIFYMHPYELDTERYPDYYFEALKDQPLKKQITMRSKWINRDTVYGKVKRLLENHRFTSVIHLIESSFQPQTSL